MPDYNPKDVPTLDDIIEKVVTDNAKVVIEDVFVESDDAVIEVAEYDINQFSAESIDQDTDSNVSDETEPQPGDINEDGNEDKSDAPIIDVQSVEPAPQVSIEPISLKLIVNDIVKQLMPDLEQQLKLRLQQALEEELPEELIKPTDTDHEN